MTDLANDSSPQEVVLSPPKEGAVRLSGSPKDRLLLEALSQRYCELYGKTSFDYFLYGPDSTIASIYCKVADVAFMSREILEPMERMAYQWVFLKPPIEIDYAYGALSKTRVSSQLEIIVNPRNPIKRIDVEQLNFAFNAAIGGAEISWVDIGLRGEFSANPVNLYGPTVTDISALYFRRFVMEDSRKWNPNYYQCSDYKSIVLKVENNTNALAFLPSSMKTHNVRSIPVSHSNHSSAVTLSKDNVLSDTYPLTRRVSMIIAPWADVNSPKLVDKFLQFVLSDKGQQIISQYSDYLPLSQKNRSIQLKKLYR